MEERHVFNTTEYRLGEYLIAAVRMLLATELLFLALTDILSSAFERWCLSETSFWGIQQILVLAVIFFGIAAPVCGKYRMVVYALLEVGLLALGGWFTWKHFDRLKDGLFGLCDDYLKAWNAYYKTNYIVGDSWLQTGWTLGFLILVLVLLCLLLRYVTGVRLLMLLPPLCALALDLLVDCLPDWEGLACLLMGTLVLYSGPAESSKLMFVPMRGRERRGRRVWLQLGALVLVTVLAFGVISAAGGLFAAPAGRIPEKTPQFLAFQSRLENDIMRLGSGIHFASGRERVDNATPRYRDEQILTITMSEAPMTNVYLPEFYSGTYRGGQWVKEKREFQRAAAKSGYDADHMSMLIRQMGYENLNVIVKEIFEVQRGLESRYTIVYGKQRTDSAWIPYLADITSLEGAVWVENEGTVKKRWSTDTLTFTGWTYNMGLEGFIPYIDMLESESNEKDAIDWYSSYVREHYQDGSSLAAVQEMADEQRGRGIMISQISSVVLSSMAMNPSAFEGDNLSESTDAESFYFMGENSAETNSYRLTVATLVSHQLAERCVYNLYLDDIPAGTDTIQYFLETGHEGYCMHFASAGALILQELGIPARYASGYIVKRDAFSGSRSEGYSAQVLDRNAHAWVEIYLEDIGWVPVEMTPGYKSGESELPTDADKQDELMEQHENKEEPQEDSEEFVPDKDLNQPTETEDSETENSETDSKQDSETEQQSSETQGAGFADGSGGSGSGALLHLIARIVGIAAAIIAVPAACILLVRRCIRRYHEVLWEEMKKKQNRRAVQRINRRIYRRLQGGMGAFGHIRFSFVRGSGSAGVQWVGITDAEYEAKLVRTYSSITQQEWAEYMRIVKKAAFADEAIGESELRHCYRVYKMRNKREHKSKDENQQE